MSQSMDSVLLALDERIKARTDTKPDRMLAEVMEVGTGADAGKVKVKLPGEATATADLPFSPVVGQTPTVGQQVHTFVSKGGRLVLTGGGGGGGTGYTSQTHLEGLVPEWVSPGTDQNQLRLSSGSCYIPGAGRIVEAAAAITPPAAALVASTMYHVYGYADANGALALDPLSTIAPDAPYRGTARTKTADNTRRYLFSISTNADATPRMHNFLFVAGGRVEFREYQALVMRVLASGTATVETAVSCATFVPLTSRSAYLRLQNFGDQPFRTGTSDDSAGGPPDAAIVQLPPAPAGGHILAYLDHPLNTSRQLTYWFKAAVSAGGGAHIDLYGYLLER